MSMPKPFVGQSLYMRRGHYGETSFAQVVEVTMVGREYFATTGARSDTLFHLDTWRQKTDYSPFYRLWPSEEDYRVEEETGQLRSKIRGQFAGYSEVVRLLTLDQLQRIQAILDEP